MKGEVLKIETIKKLQKIDKLIKVIEEMDQETWNSLGRTILLEILKGE